MKELRQFERFPLTIPARVEIFFSNKRQFFHLKTHDISASGVFLYTPQIFPNGTNFKLNLTVPNARIKKMTGAESLIDCEGIVVRSASSGVGIHFDKGCRISSLIDCKPKELTGDIEKSIIFN